MDTLTRRTLLRGTMAGAASLMVPRLGRAADLGPVEREIQRLRGAGRKPPVNFVLVAEGEEEIGSIHFAQVVRKPEIAAALAKTAGIFMPSASQDPDGNVTTTLGAKGVIELELIASGEKWGRGPD